MAEVELDGWVGQLVCPYEGESLASLSLVAVQYLCLGTLA